MKLPGLLKSILDDNVSGSLTLLKRLMIALDAVLLNPDMDPIVFISYIKHIRQKMKMFTVIRHFCDELLLTHNISEKSFPAIYLNFIAEYKEFWENAPKMLLHNLQSAIDLKNKTVMLHSNSGTIRAVFRLLSNEHTNIKFYQTMAAPMEEGRIQAHDLAEMGFKVTLIPDALAAEKLRSVDILMLGADQVRKDSVVNKCGSYQMALAANEFNVPVYLLTETRKMNSTEGSGRFVDKPRDPSEVLDDIVHPNLGAENLYFEEFPKHLVSYFITERSETR